jgi:hypothetical protein
VEGARWRLGLICVVCGGNLVVTGAVVVRGESCRRLVAESALGRCVLRACARRVALSPGLRRMS